jgi:hypothetical protein
MPNPRACCAADTPLPVDTVGDPLAVVLRRLTRRAESPRAARWAEALLSRGEAASDRVGERASRECDSVAGTVTT